MEKIEIEQVAEEIFSHRGFGDLGCYSSVCMDNCCRLGCDVDRESYELIWAHKGELDTMLGYDLGLCFEGEWSGQEDFLGRNSIASTVINGTCAFHIRNGKGCVLWQKVLLANGPKRMIPSTCRLYPVTWNQGRMHLVECIEKECNCIDPQSSGPKNLWETQKEAIEDIFLIKGPVR